MQFKDVKLLVYLRNIKLLIVRTPKIDAQHRKSKMQGAGVPFNG